MLQLSHLSVRFKDQLILNDISFSLESHTIHALMGPNGSGKSTLAATLLGYPSYTISEGSISFNGEDITHMPTEKRARLGLFLVQQQPPAVPGVQVLTFLKEAYRMLTGQDCSVKDFKELVYQAFDAVQLDHSFLYRNVHEGFSGGEKKRLEAAQILLFKPKLAILDELDSGLDRDALERISLVLKECQVKTGMSLLVITHYYRMLEFLEPSTVHVLHKGALLMSDDGTLAKRIENQGYDGLQL